MTGGAWMKSITAMPHKKQAAMYFTESFVSVMIIGALILISIAVIVLLALLITDIKNKKLW
ncbi:hypothetical protein GCM10009415_34640 [Chitinophaga japonensis]